MPNRVYIIEDHDNLRRLIVIALALLDDFEICGTSSSGEDALEKMADAKPTLALIDLSLPGISGFDVITAARERFPAIRCIVFSGHHQWHYAEKALAQGASGYVVKGRPAEMIEALRCAARGETYLSPNLIAE